VSDAFEYRLEMLKKELDAIESSIRKIDDIGNSVKNWAIVTWTGSIAVLLGKPELHKFVFFTAMPPLMFMIVDAFWRTNQRRFVYRQGQISDLLNSKKLDQAFISRTFDFKYSIQWQETRIRGMTSSVLFLCEK
jgi:hypothetical protein